jgi:hypothetical protein
MAVLHAGAQALPAAERPLQIAVFAAGAERATQLSGARNLDLTCGLDIGFLPLRAWSPAVEVRGSIPGSKGSIAGEAEVLGGLRMGRRLGDGSGPALVYVDLLFGQGQITYFGAGLQVPGQNVFYTQSNSMIVSPGGGLEVEMGGRFALRVDTQIERYATPVKTSREAWAMAATAGVVYRLDFDGRRGRGW